MQILNMGRASFILGLADLGLRLPGLGWMIVESLRRATDLFSSARGGRWMAARAQHHHSCDKRVNQKDSIRAASTDSKQVLALLAALSSAWTTISQGLKIQSLQPKVWCPQLIPWGFLLNSPGLGKARMGLNHGLVLRSCPRLKSRSQTACSRSRLAPVIRSTGSSNCCNTMLALGLKNVLY